MTSPKASPIPPLKLGEHDGYYPTLVKTERLEGNRERSYEVPMTTEHLADVLAALPEDEAFAMISHCLRPVDPRDLTRESVEEDNALFEALARAARAEEELKGSKMLVDVLSEKLNHEIDCQKVERANAARELASVGEDRDTAWTKVDRLTQELAAEKEARRGERDSHIRSLYDVRGLLLDMMDAHGRALLQGPLTVLEKAIDAAELTERKAPEPPKSEANHG